MNQLMEILDYLQIICIKCMWIKKDQKKIDFEYEHIEMYTTCFVGYQDRWM